MHRVYLNALVASGISGGVSLTLRQHFFQGISVNYPLAMRLFKPPSMTGDNRQNKSLVPARDLPDSSVVQSVG
jgi:hypothetical protein